MTQDDSVASPLLCASVFVRVTFSCAAGDWHRSVGPPPLHVLRIPGQGGQVLGPGVQQGTRFFLYEICFLTHYSFLKTPALLCLKMLSVCPLSQACNMHPGSSCACRCSKQHWPARTYAVVRRLAAVAEMCMRLGSHFSSIYPAAGHPAVPRPPERHLLAGAAPDARRHRHRRPRLRRPRLGHAHQSAGAQSDLKESAVQIDQAGYCWPCQPDSEFNGPASSSYWPLGHVTDYGRCRARAITM